MSRTPLYTGDMGSTRNECIECRMHQIRAHDPNLIRGLIQKKKNQCKKIEEEVKVKQVFSKTKLKNMRLELMILLCLKSLTNLNNTNKKI